jgi:chaperonin cofactor prefoldin
VNTSRCIRTAALALLSCGLVSPLLAQTARGGGESQRIMQQYQQLAAEKTALEAQVVALKHDLDAARTELGTVKKERDALKARSAAAGASVSALTAGKEAAEKSAAQSQERMNELVTHFRETANNLKQVETDREQLRGQLRERSAAFDQCAADNLSLYEINADLLMRYEHVGLFTRVSASEPFTRITRSRIENLVDGYRARALELRARSATSNAGEEAGGTPPRP